jgi:hypothetical protein
MLLSSSIGLEPFAASRLKIARAKRHIGEFRDAAQQFLLSAPARIVAEQLPEWEKLDSIVWTVRDARPIPIELSAILGDAIHNLRTALDLMATDLVRLNGKSTKKVYFPFAFNARELDAQIKAKNMDRAAPDALKLLRSLKPYAGGNAALRGLHDLDITDKHQALIPAVAATSLPPLTLIIGTHANPIASWDTTITHDGQMVLIMPAPGNISLGEVLPAAFRLVFATGNPFAGEEIVPTLPRLYEHVLSTVEAFSTLYIGRSWSAGPPDTSSHGRRTLLIGHPESPRK